jgi:hypothetical protein
MNIYMPFPDLTKSAECLDDRRLDKVRSDISAVLRACAESAPADGKEHSAVKMWRGNERFLINYGIAVCSEWMSRGNADITLGKMIKMKADFPPDSDQPPEWFGTDELHKSHQSMLLRLQPSHYKEYFGDTPDDIQMFWPRSPQKMRASKNEKDQAKKIQRARRLKEKAENCIEDAREAAIDAGLDPDTLEPLADVEVDPELANL